MFRNVKLFRLQEFIRHEARQKNSFRKVPPIRERPRAIYIARCEDYSLPFLFEIILSQFNQLVIKELGLTLQLYFCIFMVRAGSSPFFLLERSKLNFLCLQCSSFVGEKRTVKDGMIIAKSGESGRG
jgi:hypothetical protein